MSKYTAQEINEWPDSIQAPDYKWKPARPLNYKFVSLKTRIKHAWGVLTKKYDILDWEDYE